MNQSPKVLGAFTQIHQVIPEGRRIHRIEFWGGYGTVCPGLTTSNGNTACVARHLFNEMANLEAIRQDLPGYEVELTLAGELLPNTSTEKSIFERLIGALTSSA